MPQYTTPIYQTSIPKEWLDYNHHLNVAYYLMIFDKAAEAFMESIQLGEASAKERKISWMVLENHLTYQRELSLDQTVEVGINLLDYDHKRVHLYFEMMTLGESPYLASTMEQMVICADLQQRSSAAFPSDVMECIQQFKQQHSNLQSPSPLSGPIAIRRC